MESGLGWAEAANIARTDGSKKRIDSEQFEEPAILIRDMAHADARQ
jgi:hypothetical protein